MVGGKPYSWPGGRGAWTQPQPMSWFGCISIGLALTCLLLVASYHNPVRSPLRRLGVEVQLRGREKQVKGEGRHQRLQVEQRHAEQ